MLGLLFEVLTHLTQLRVVGESPRGQWAQETAFFFEHFLTPGIESIEEFVQKSLVLRARGKITAASQDQCLLNGPFDPVMALLHVSIFIAAIGVGLLTRNVIVTQQRITSDGQTSLLIQIVDRRREPIRRGVFLPTYA